MALYYAWMTARAALWIALVSFLLWRATGDRFVTRAYALAHLAALAAGAIADFRLWELVTGRSGSVGARQAFFLAPIAVFTVIALVLENRRRPLKVWDPFLALVPVVVLAGLSLKGWHADFPDILGAWFVSAASGGIDLGLAYGPERPARVRAAVRLAAWIALPLIVYAALPATESVVVR
jgi:hypothetical protein